VTDGQTDRQTELLSRVKTKLDRQALLDAKYCLGVVAESYTQTPCDFDL